MTYLLVTLVTFYLLWVHYLAVMHLKELGPKLQGPALWLGKLVLGLGLLLDLFWQVLPASVLWLELPKELTVSGRVERLCKTGHGYRYNLAVWFRNTWLALFDPSGDHGEVQFNSREDQIGGLGSP
jgi:hypothetical protein